MHSFVKRFWTWVVSLSGVVGLYLGALAVNLVWAFFVVVGISLAVGLAPKIYASARLVAMRLRNYPKLLERIALLEVMPQEKSVVAWRAGVNEGRAQAIGAVISVNVEPPQLTAISLLGEEVCLIVKFQVEPEMVQALQFNVTHVDTGEIKGLVRGCKVDSEKSIVYLQCVEATVPEFWSHLKEKAPYDPSPPAGFELSKVTLKDLGYSMREFDRNVAGLGEVGK
ncbi:hypothetical protein [Amycolatopsis sp. cmx-4-68]|uniref:hypothetical protein n=1 Tax=Amycolatopsis sp. cmx-4-68 TaxID=2790938 RepID=UPI0039785820